jgi:hypothetical protein
MSDTAKRYIVDWSGNTGLAICPICGERSGPYFTRAETAHVAKTHYQLSHHVPEPKPTTSKLPCSEEDCGAPSLNKGLCSKHYQRDLKVRKGIVRGAPVGPLVGAKCRDLGCETLAKVKGRCQSHYYKARYATQKAKAALAKARAEADRA